MDNEKGAENVSKLEGGGFLKAHIFTLTVPQASFVFPFFDSYLLYLWCIVDSRVHLVKYMWLSFQIDGGTNISVKLRWSQKLSYHDGQFTLNIPFNFPEYVTPAAKKIAKREKIELNVNAGPETEVLCKTTSHPLKVPLFSGSDSYYGLSKMDLITVLFPFSFIFVGYFRSDYDKQESWVSYMTLKFFHGQAVILCSHTL